MQKTKNETRSLAMPKKGMKQSMLRQFGREEDGSMIVLTVILLILMLVMGGMAVDFMRFESRRASLQSVADRAVLAAAELDQRLDRVDVVEDYFKKAGYEGAIVGTPSVGGTGNSRNVGVQAKVDLNTFYLRLIGINTLSAPASASAIEGAGDIEISLAVDMSGSMYSQVPGQGGKRRIDLLEEAATSFVEKLLIPEYEDQVSISLIPYSSQVNVGDGIFGELNVAMSGDSGSLGGGTGFGSEEPPEDLDLEDVVGVSIVGPNPARCVEMPETEFQQTDFNTTRTYQQSQQWQTNTWGKGGTSSAWNGLGGPSTRNNTNSELDQPLCPNQSFEEIIPLSQNATELTNAIKDLEPRGGTAVYMGLKWAVTLLDPSFRGIVAGLPEGEAAREIDPAFHDVRPLEYKAPDNDSQATKYLILMTDGQNDGGRRLKDEHFETAEQIDFWTTYNYAYLRWAAYNSSTWDATWPYERDDFRGNYTTVFDSFFNEEGYSNTEADQLMQDMCREARERNIIVYTIAFGAPDNGKKQMEDCASKPTGQYYKETEGDTLKDIFDEIAKQITDLRLSL